MKSEAPRLCFELPKGKTVNIPLPRKGADALRRAARVDISYGDIKFLL